jgi:hypothetical protein
VGLVAAAIAVRYTYETHGCVVSRSFKTIDRTW